MRAFLVPLGLFLVAVAAIDELWTTVWVGLGVGPLSRRLTGTAWRVVLRRASHHKRHLFLRRAGFAIVLGALLMWLVLLWAGWWLVFEGSERAVVAAADGRPAGTIARIYYAGSSVLTLGNGDYRPGGAPWQIATVAATASGLFFVSLSITYLVPVVSAVAQKRQVAASIAGLGRSAEDILTSVWNGRDFEGFDHYLMSVGPELASLAQQFVSYPILYFFHTDDRSVASGPGVAALDEALTIFEYGIIEECRPSRVAMRWARGAIDDYLETLHGAFMGPSEEPPPPADLDRLRRSGLPVLSTDEFHAAMAALTHRRRRLRGLVEGEGWTWRDVQPAPAEDGADR